MVVPAGGKARGMFVFVALVGTKFDGGGKVGDRTETELIVKENLTDEVGPVRRGVGSMG